MPNNVETIKKNLEDYSWVKEHLSLQAIAIKGNEAFLKDVPHMQIEDLAFIARITWDEYTTIVNANVLKHLCIDSKTLFSDAVNLSEERRPLVIQNLAEVLCKMTGNAEMPVDFCKMPLYVCMAGDLERPYGASVLAYSSFVQQAFTELGGSFYILPSSQHEVLLYKDNEDIPKEELLNMVCTINATEVEAKDRLSDSVYYCDGVSIRKVA